MKDCEVWLVKLASSSLAITGGVSPGCGAPKWAARRWKIKAAWLRPEVLKAWCFVLSKEHLFCTWDILGYFKSEITKLKSPNGILRFGYGTFKKGQNDEFIIFNHFYFWV